MSCVQGPIVDAVYNAVAESQAIASQFVLRRKGAAAKDRNLAREEKKR